MFCLKCGSSNDVAAKVCIGCGGALSLTAKSSVKPVVQVEAAGFDDAYYRAVLGDKNQDYYLDHFARFDDENKISPTWNWSAFSVTLFWLLYRKMWRGAGIYFALPLALQIVFFLMGLVLGGFAGFVVTLVSFAYLLAIFVVVPAYANGFYYLHCKQMIEAVCSTTPDKQAQLDALSATGGSNHKVLVVGVALSVMVFLGVMTAIAIPAYQDRVARSRLVLAHAVGISATQYVDGYYTQYSSIPRNLDAANFMMTLPPFVKAVTVDNQTNTITITMSGGSAIEGKSFKFVTMPGGDHLSWRCLSNEIADRYLPPECRSEL